MENKFSPRKYLQENGRKLPIEMGLNGKPCYIQGPYDNHLKIISALNASAGSGGYEYITEV